MSLEELEIELFLLDMKDHFEPDDYERRDQLVKKIEELKNEHQ